MSDTQANQPIYQDPELADYLKKLVLARIGVMPQGLEVAVGDSHLSKQELYEHVVQSDEIGQEIMEAELEFLQDMASGAIYDYE